jgi:hypothetical protein
VDVWGSGVGESLCATSRREQKKRKKKQKKNDDDDDDGRFVGGTIDSVRSEINGADLVVKIVQGPFVVCRIVPPNTKWNCSIKRKRNLFQTISLCLLLCIYRLYDFIRWLRHDVERHTYSVASDYNLSWRGFPSHHVRFLEIDSYIRY